ncbi:baseplate J/gp47 family protein [Spartinivicinus ruber]|uniref:baseplate J/gp47 family protein n=1 Tax=Spartinivicinus ruber TaxID=2683272 RepID=UPI0013D1F7F7|nr:baseplate J/gp47 family protein [Spartinivicinus ruber]
MMIPGHNQLAMPEALEVPDYENLFTEYKQRVVEFIAKQDQTQAKEVATTLENDAEIITKLLQALVYIRQHDIRQLNYQAQQMFAWWAKGSNLDAVVSNLGLERHPNESDDDLRLRYFLAPYAFSVAGPHKAYVYHALMLGEKPDITLEKTSPTEFNLRYQFRDNGLASQIKSATAIRPEPGKVIITLLAYDQLQLAFAETEAAKKTLKQKLDTLLENANAYFARDDVAPATDQITVQLAELIPYTVDVECYVYSGPDAGLTQQSAKQALENYTDQQFTLHAAIDAGQIYHVLHQSGAVQVDLMQPEKRLITTQQQAPYCTGINITMKTLS